MRCGRLLVNCRRTQEVLNSRRLLTRKPCLGAQVNKIPKGMIDDDKGFWRIDASPIKALPRLSPLAVELRKYNHLSTFQGIWEAGQIGGKQVMQLRSVIWNPQLGKKKSCNLEEGKQRHANNYGRHADVHSSSLLIFQNHNVDKAILSRRSPNTWKHKAGGPEGDASSLGGWRPPCLWHSCQRLLLHTAHHAPHGRR